MIHQNTMLCARYCDLVVHSSDNETVRYGAFNNPVSNIDPTLRRWDMKGNEQARREKDKDEAYMWRVLTKQVKTKGDADGTFDFRMNQTVRVSCTFLCPKWLVAKISVRSIRNDIR